MAKQGTAGVLNSNWTKASELYLKPIGVSLELNRLKSFFPFGLQRGTLIEITGSKSSGRTSASLYILAESISKGETCACIDLNSQFDPFSLFQTGVALDRLAWIRCWGNTEHALRSTDLLLHAGGFGVVLLDLCGAKPQILNKIPISYWFRFQRAIQDTSTILLICSDHLQSHSCSRGSIKIELQKLLWTGDDAFSLLHAMESTITHHKVVATKVTAIRPESLLIHMAYSTPASIHH